MTANKERQQRLEADRERRVALHQPDVVMDDSYGVIQVVLPPAVQGPLREWLAARGLSLYQIPVEDDLPTYGVGFAP